MMDSAFDSSFVSIPASLAFLEKDPLYETEKPYRLGYDSENVPATNLIRQFVHGIQMQDLRGFAHELTFERNGIAVLETGITMRYKEFNDSKLVIGRYCNEIGQILLDYMKAKTVQVFDYNVSQSHRTQRVSLTETAED